MICRELENNLISFQFHSSRDMDRVLSMEPWQFNKHVLVLAKLSANIQPSFMRFDKTPCWIRVYDIPIMGRQKKSLQLIGNRFGEVLEIEDNKFNGLARSIRLKIILDLNKPLKRGTHIRMGNVELCWIPITYERLPSFCYWCGKLGHSFKDCDDYHEQGIQEGDEVEKNLPYGEWMKSPPMKQAQVIPRKGRDDTDKLRRSLFQHHDTTKDDIIKGVGEERNKGELFNAEQRVADLLQSLEKVQVEEKKKEILGDDNDKGSEERREQYKMGADIKSGNQSGATISTSLVATRSDNDIKPGENAAEIFYHTTMSSDINKPTKTATQNPKPDKTSPKIRETHIINHPPKDIPHQPSHLNTKPEHAHTQPIKPITTKKLSDVTRLQEQNQPYTPTYKLIELIRQVSLQLGLIYIWGKN